MMTKAQRKQAQALREKALRESKARRAAVDFAPRVMSTHEQTLEALAESRKVPVKSLREFQAEDQERLAVALGTAAVWLAAFGWADDAGAFAANAFGKAQNALRLRNPEPMMEEVHKAWLAGLGNQFANPANL